MKKPNWVTKKFRRWVLQQCPYCKKQLQTAIAGLFFNSYYFCPDRHYAEETLLGVGTIIYDRGGETFPPPPTVEIKGEPHARA
jgi:hypothetical protein